MKSQINSLEDAFKAQGIDPLVRPEVSDLPEIDQKQTVRNFELDVLVRALNSEGLDKTWVPDYSNGNELKYEHCYFHSSASGWSLHFVGHWSANARCSSRRVFRTPEIANDAWDRFSELFKAVL